MYVLRSGHEGFVLDSMANAFETGLSDGVSRSEGRKLHESLVQRLV